MIRAMKNRDPNERDQDSAANEAEMHAAWTTKYSCALIPNSSQKPALKQQLTGAQLLVQRISCARLGFIGLHIKAVKNMTKLKCECYELFLFYSFGRKVM